MLLQMIVILFVINLCPGGWFEDMTFILLFIFALLELVLLVVILIRKKWIPFFASVAILIGLVVMLPMFSLFLMSAPDGYAKHHPIPNGMELNIPLDPTFDSVLFYQIGYEEAVVDSNDENSFLQIWNGFQGGIYQYDFYYPSLSAGTIFLRCFEAGKNEPLSADRLGEASSVGHTSTSYFTKIVDKKNFTIYEGDWDEYYAVRVEVWHRDSTTQKETKLMEKFYRMEGWMR